MHSEQDLSLIESLVAHHQEQRERIRSILFSLDALKEENIHHFRKEAKYLFAVSRLRTLWFSEESSNYTSEILKRIFKISGKIRDFQLILRYLKEYSEKSGNRLPVCETYFSNKLERKLLKYRNQLSVKNLDLLNEQLIAFENALGSLNASTMQSDLQSYVHSLLLKAQNNRLINKKKALHRMRRQLKEAFFLDHFMSFYADEYRPIFREGFEEFLNTLGIWQDYALMNSFRKKLPEACIEETGFLDMMEQLKTSTKKSQQKVLKESHHWF